MEKILVLIGFKDDLAILSAQSNGQNIGREYQCSKAFFPIDSKIGDSFKLSVSLGVSDNDPNKALAKNILNEILNIENSSV